MTPFEKGHQVRKCSSCGADIVFLKTHRNSYMPCDAQSVEEGDDMFDKKKHISHFSTCPEADKHRKRGGGGPRYGDHRG